jgi:hypothetical protein
LEVTATLFSLLLVVLLLVAQKHEDELNAHRDTLTLELAILSEHKIAKGYSAFGGTAPGQSSCPRSARPAGATNV